MAKSRFFWHSSLAGLAVALVGSALGAQPAAAEYDSVTFTLINSTSRVLEEFYASPPSSSSWEEDILGVDVLNPGESIEITIDDGREDCLYDFKGVLGPGNGVGRGALIQSSVSVCDGGTYEYSE